MVLATFSTRWNPRADRCNWFIAALSNPCPAGSTLQYSRTCAGPISALHVSFVPWKRRCCTARAASTLSRIRVELSPTRSSESFSYCTRGTSTWMSMRSSSGPEMRFW